MITHRHLIVRPDGGLGNRLRAIISGIALAAESGRTLTIQWTKRDQVGAALGELFTLPFKVIDTDKRPPADVRINTWEPARGRIQQVPVFSNAGVIWVESCQHFRAGDGDDPSNVNGSCEDGIYQIGLTQARYTYLIGMAPAVATKVQDISPQVRGKVGVHIRRGDHERARKYSPTEVIHGLMDQCFPSCFFVTSDDSREEEKAKCRYGHRVFCRADRPRGHLHNPSCESTIEAAVDMMLLARCRMIIGCCRSSFAQTAAIMGGIPLMVAFQAPRVVDGEAEVGQ